MTKTSNQLIGQIGEDYAVKHLISKDYKIVERNYLRKWGEIDIIALKNDVLYFVEVKTRSMNFYINGTDWHRPEDNLHRYKLMRVKRAIQSYLLESHLSIESEWEFSAIAVIVKRKTRELYKIEHLENLII